MSICLLFRCLTPHEGKGLLFHIIGIKPPWGGLVGRGVFQKKNGGAALEGKVKVQLRKGESMESTEQRESRGGRTEGLPFQAYASGIPDDPSTWKLPHHTNEVKKAVRGKVGIERTVDWTLVDVSVQLLSRLGYHGMRLQATENEILDADQHLALFHYVNGMSRVEEAVAVSSHAGPGGAGVGQPLHQAVGLQDVEDGG